MNQTTIVILLLTAFSTIACQSRHTRVSRGPEAARPSNLLPSKLVQTLLNFARPSGKFRPPQKISRPSQSIQKTAEYSEYGRPATGSNPDHTDNLHQFYTNLHNLHQQVTTIKTNENIINVNGGSMVILDNRRIITLRTDLQPSGLEEDVYVNSTPIRHLLEKYGKNLERKSNEVVSSPKRYKVEKVPDAHVGSKIPVLGSNDPKVFKGVGDYGFFSTVYAAYSNHWMLRTVPDDWWYTIIQTIAVAIDQNAKNDNVRKFFVDHQKKKELVVQVDGCTPHNVDYSWFFNQMTTQIQDNIKVPGYVNTLRSDFSTSTPMNKIISEITVMTSTQQYFEYTMNMVLCGVPKLEMVGSEQDWIHLKEKLLQIKHILKPIETEIGLHGWWSRVEVIFDKLLDTYRGSPDTDWWGQIYKKDTIRRGCSTSYQLNGWFIKDLLNKWNAKKISELRTGLVSVPMKLKRGPSCGGGEEQSALVAGIAGMEISTGESEIPVVQAKHGWSLFVEPNSTYVL